LKVGRARIVCYVDKKLRAVKVRHNKHDVRAAGPNHRTCSNRRGFHVRGGPRAAEVNGKGGNCDDLRVHVYARHHEDDVVQKEKRPQLKENILANKESVKN
jgi:hypothetical protein